MHVGVIVSLQLVCCLHYARVLGCDFDDSY